MFHILSHEFSDEVSKYLIDLVRRCWCANFNERPSFVAIQKELSRAVDILEKRLKGKRHFVSTVSVRSPDNQKTVPVPEELKKFTFGDVLQSCGVSDLEKYKLRYIEAEKLRLGLYQNENFVQPFFVNNEHVQLELLQTKNKT